MENLVGRTINKRYRVDESLGSGGMAEVYKVWDIHWSTFLAMKMLREDLSEDAVFVRRFKKEAGHLEILQHPNIVRFYGLGEYDEKDLVFLLMDYIDGITLRKEIRQAKGTPLSVNRILEVMTAVCSALHYTHQMGKVHCDVKPANIMIEKTGRILLADFGIARQAEGATTTTMAMAGTPAYMAPEQVRGEDPTPQTDIYALGVVLYEMLTGGERPFTGEQATITGTTGEKVRWEQANLKTLSPRHFNPHINEELEGIVLKCLEKNPKQRFISVQDLMTALQGSLGLSGLVEPKLEIEEKVEPKDMTEPIYRVEKTGKSLVDQRLSRLRWVGLGLGVLLILGLGFVLGNWNRGIVVFAPPAAPAVSAAPAVETMAPLTPTIEPLAPTVPVASVSEPTVTDTAPVSPPSAPEALSTPAATSVESIIESPQERNKDGMVMVYVPAGEFIMGSDDGSEDEKPEHGEELDAYWIDMFEVTNGMYAICVHEGECNPPENRRSYTRDNYFNNSGYKNFPVIITDWNQANTYCNWAGGRLPTEGEWEKAARGKKGRKFPWGNEEPNESLLNFNGNNKDTTEVGKFPEGASPYGLFDMAGNVWEWTADSILRGGSWINLREDVRSSNRSRYNPTNPYFNIGFRCVRDTSP